MAPLGIPLAATNFKLNSAALAGFLGGEEAFLTMSTMHFYKGRRWLGWYNSPGSYSTAKQLGRTANSRFWDTLFPGPKESPAEIFGLDGKQGPQYIAALSGTTMKSAGHLAYLAVERSKEMKPVKIAGRVTTPFDVTYLAMKSIDYDTPVERLPLRKALLGLIPILASQVTCIICALVGDWISFSMILIGIISSGVAGLVMGDRKLGIEYVKEPARGAPPGHGILVGEDGVIVIKGEERDVNAITKGRFNLRMDRVPRQYHEEDGFKPKPPEYQTNGVCALLLVFQFLIQLLLVPQGTLFGQIMFLVSLCISCAYNVYLSSLEKEKIQAHILFRTLGDPQMRRFRTGTRTTMAVFVCLLLFHGVEGLSAEMSRELRDKTLRHSIPNDTGVWKLWREKVVQQSLNIDEGSDSLPYLVGGMDLEKELSEPEQRLLGVLLRDARTAFMEYFRVRGDLPADSSHLKVVSG